MEKSNANPNGHHHPSPAKESAAIMKASELVMAIFNCCVTPPVHKPHGAHFIFGAKL